MRKKKIIVICGPTGVGKTSLSVLLARKHNAEIISADSMQIYRGMDIGTAKVSEVERSEIVHHLIDIKSPRETYSLSDYLTDAHNVAKGIVSRNHLPIMVGGTGLYISSFINNINLMPDAETDLSYREELKEYAQNYGNAALKELLKPIDPESYLKLSENDVKRIIRALEVYKSTGKTIGEQNALSMSTPSEYDFTVIGLTCRDRSVLYDRINDRVDDMVRSGFIDEVKALALDECSNTARQAIGYKQINAYIKGDCSLESAMENIKMESRRYAKRQLTWFRRDERVHWYYTDEEPIPEISAKVSNLITEDGI